MYSGAGTAALPAVSFLIRKSRDRRMVSSSPGLIAAAHVLHRLSVPRHPPCALVLLIRRTPELDVAMEFSRCVRAPRPPHRETPAQDGRSLKTQQRTSARLPLAQQTHAFVEIDIVLGEPGSPTTQRAIKGPGAYRRESAVSLERR